MKISNAILITHLYTPWFGNTECHLFKFIPFWRIRQDLETYLFWSAIYKI